MARTIALAIALLAAAPPALACGHCVEDRVAAVYDYRVEQEAGRQNLRVAYLGVNGPRAESEAAAATVATALRENPAAVADTVRTSVSPAAASFAWRGDDAALLGAMRSANERLAAAGLKLELLRTWDARHGLR